MRVGIVGAGIAGLALANQLHQKGIEVQIYEKASRLEPVGAGFTIQPSGFKVLEGTVDTESVLATAALVNQSQMMDAEGNLLAVDIMESLSSGAKSYSIHRGDIHEALLKDLSHGDVVKTSMRATNINSDESAAIIQFEDGTSSSFDLIIGADGIRSVARKFVSPEAKLNQSHGIAIRTLVPRSRDDLLFHNFRAWMGQGKVVLTYPVRGGEFLNIACYTDGLPQIDGSWSRPVKPDWLRNEFRGWDPSLTSLLARADSCFSWNLADIEKLQNWNRKRVVLVGDAAHAMVPYLGQGANQALVDCYELSNSLGKVADDQGTLAEALQEYEQSRKHSVALIQQLSRKAGHIFKSDFDGNRDIKNLEITALLKKVSAVQTGSA
ncbi:FAD-dependent oxidoreductase [Corynebacterium lactis]|uniref:FAD-binding domain-containing protein n=1 Tax=Corynebacterium lactis RW2-5 TaxID=1408189 RepID=A0A0K2H3U3_9CORY|nr:NAD(P)/FAD-dependent oxidoreductase [Corynebacterium lactis]ALA68371.1 hypothetical protein CLAC_01260 [Corynebacterium lactis RW2-5]